MSRYFQGKSREPVNRLARSDNGQPIGTSNQPALTEKATQFASTFVEKVENTIQSRPLTCLGIAAGLGVLAAFWSKRK